MATKLIPQIPVEVDANGNIIGIAFSGGGAGGGGSDRELVVTSYVAKTNFTDVAIGDIVTSTQVIDVSSTPYTVGILWRNQTTNVDLLVQPNAKDLSPINTSDEKVTQAMVQITAGQTFTVTASSGKRNITISNLDLTGSFSTQIMSGGTVTSPVLTTRTFSNNAYYQYSGMPTYDFTITNIS